MAKRRDPEVADLFEPRESIGVTAEWLTALRQEIGPDPVLGVDYHHRLSVAETASFSAVSDAGGSAIGDALLPDTVAVNKALHEVLTLIKQVVPFTRIIVQVHESGFVSLHGQFPRALAHGPPVLIDPVHDATGRRCNGAADDGCQVATVEIPLWQWNSSVGRQCWQDVGAHDRLPTDPVLKDCTRP